MNRRDCLKGMVAGACIPGLSNDQASASEIDPKHLVKTVREFAQTDVWTEVRMGGGYNSYTSEEELFDDIFEGYGRSSKSQERIKESQRIVRKAIVDRFGPKRYKIVPFSEFVKGQRKTFYVIHDSSIEALGDYDKSLDREIEFDDLCWSAIALPAPMTTRRRHEGSTVYMCVGNAINTDGKVFGLYPDDLVFFEA